MCTRSPARTSRAGLAGCWLDSILPSSQARAAKARVLKNLAAHSHLSMRTFVVAIFDPATFFPRNRILICERPITRDHGDCRPAKALADGSQPVQSGPAGGTAVA